MRSDSPQRTVLDVLARRLATDPDGPYLDFEGTQVTARQIDEEAGRLAHALADLGVARGDRVATLLENRPEQVVSFFATLKLGAIHQPVNTAYRGEFLRHQLADAGVKVLIVQGDLASRVQQVAGSQTPELESVIVLGKPDETITAKPQYDWQELLTGRSADAVPDPKIGPSDLACFIYTSGTTGPSKGCMLPHNYVVTLADQIARAGGRRPEDVVLTPLPLFHLSALAVGVVGTLLVGGRASIGRRFSVSRFWPEVKRTGATIISMLGSLATLIANSKDDPDQVGHTLRVCMAVPMPPDTDKVWRERFGCASWSGGYGLTEASFIATLAADQVGKPGSPGKPNSHEFDVKIFDDDDYEVPLGEVGEIVCRPKLPNVMFAGYFRRPQETLAVLRNLWLHTGDLGRIDEDGFLFFVDRKKDYLRRRGENISSFELEKIFLHHEAIKDVAVHSVPSEVGEDEVKVTAILREGAKLTQEELCAWAVSRLPYFAIPRYIEFRDDLPRTPSGKVQKYQLREEGKTPATWDREAAGFTFERR
jgi:crotonobetaine/carnitine-CoA ligase